MNLATKVWIVTATGLAAIGMIAAIGRWAYLDVGNANSQRLVTSEIARGLTDLRLVTFEYRLYHNERAREQWSAVSDRVDRLVANARFPDPGQEEILAGLREKMAAMRRLFVELVAAYGVDRADTALDNPNRQFEAQVLSQLLTRQQDSFTDAFRLNDLATERIGDTQHWVRIVILAGLAVITTIMVSTALFLRRDVLAPIARLRKATRQIAGGDWDFSLGVHANDEIGDLSSNFDAMTKSLRRAFAQIERSNHELATLNEELEAFSYSVSHDLRAPLRSMDGFSAGLLEDYGDKLDAEGKDALQRIRAASQRMGNLIDDLLGLSKVTCAELNATGVDLSAMAHEIANTLPGELSGHTVEWAIEAGLSVRADPALMRIAMQNLLQNASKFTGKAQAAVIRVGALARDAATVYFVSDNGAGFDMVYADGLFSAFQRLHDAEDFPGTGIGLATVQRIIHRHQGEIWAEATEGAGATFFFTVKEAKNGSGEQDHPVG